MFSGENEEEREKQLFFTSKNNVFFFFFPDNSIYSFRDENTNLIQ